MTVIVYLATLLFKLLGLLMPAHNATSLAASNQAAAVLLLLSSIWLQYLDTGGPGHQGLAHIAGVEGGGGLDVIPVLAGEGVGGLLLAYIYEIISLLQIMSI